MPRVCTSRPYSHLPGDEEEGPRGRDSEGAQEERPTKRATTGSKGVKGEEVSASDGYTPQNSEEMVVVRGHEGMYLVLSTCLYSTNTCSHGRTSPFSHTTSKATQRGVVDRTVDSSSALQANPRAHSNHCILR